MRLFHSHSILRTSFLMFLAALFHLPSMLIAQAQEDSEPLDISDISLSFPGRVFAFDLSDDGKYLWLAGGPADASAAGAIVKISLATSEVASGFNLTDGILPYDINLREDTLIISGYCDENRGLCDGNEGWNIYQFDTLKNVRSQITETNLGLVRLRPFWGQGGNIYYVGFGNTGERDLNTEIQVSWNGIFRVQLSGADEPIFSWYTIPDWRKMVYHPSAKFSNIRLLAESHGTVLFGARFSAFLSRPDISLRGARERGDILDERMTVFADEKVYHLTEIKDRDRRILGKVFALTDEKIEIYDAKIISLEELREIEGAQYRRHGNNVAVFAEDQLFLINAGEILSDANLKGYQDLLPSRNIEKIGGSGPNAFISTYDPSGGQIISVFENWVPHYRVRVKSYAE